MCLLCSLFSAYLHAPFSEQGSADWLERDDNCTLGLMSLLLQIMAIGTLEHINQAIALVGHLQSSEKHSRNEGTPVLLVPLPIRTQNCHD